MIAKAVAIASAQLETLDLNQSAISVKDFGDKSVDCHAATP